MHMYNVYTCTLPPLTYMYTHTPHVGMHARTQHTTHRVSKSPDRKRSRRSEERKKKKSGHAPRESHRDRDRGRKKRRDSDREDKGEGEEETVRGGKHRKNSPERGRKERGRKQ